MAAVEDIAAALESAIAAIPTVRAHKEQPDSVQVTDGVAVVYPIPREGSYHEAFDDGEVTTWDIIILAAPASIGYARGQVAINPYIARSGTSSVKAAIEADGTLGGVVDCLSVTRWYDRGLIEVNDQAYWGVRLECQIWE